MRSLFIVAGTVSTILLAGCSGGGGGDLAPPVQPPTSPAEFSALYEELSTNLSARENELRADWDGVHTPVIYAATLLTASSNNGVKLLDPTFRAGNSLTLSRLAGLGVRGIVLQINYPILTSSFIADAPAYLTAFEEIADEIRTLGLKVIVEHNVLLSGYSAIDPAAYYATLNKTRFGQENYAEVQDIVERIKPDYLSIVTEPGTFESVLQLQMSIADWRAYVEGVVNQLAVDMPGRSTKIGAGSGAWEDQDFVTNFASLNGLDYIDIHSYPLTNDITSYLELLDTWPAMIHAINPSLEIVSSESWLYKAQAAELGGAPTGSEFFARDAYGFWGDLDSQFLKILAISAHKNSFSVIAPFWSNYFFAYLDYNDPSLSGLASEEILDRAFLAAAQAIQDGQSSDVGQTYKAFIEGNGP